MNKELDIRIGISIGDINGIGPEVIIKSLSDQRILLDCTPIIYASNKILSYHKKIITDIDFSYQSCKTAKDAHPKKVNVINLWNEEIAFKLGKNDPIAGKYAFESLKHATNDLAHGTIDVLVTAPISKQTIASAGFNFPGHTEYLAHLSNTQDALMMMVTETLRIALVTTHIALKDVTSAITQDKVVHKIQQLNKSLQYDFGIRKPKIAVLGLNPHAGENGKIGEEEQNIIIPAIKEVQTSGILAFGPYPADSFFGARTHHKFDAILAMYHDQGLTAFKTLSFDEGVNFTAGLPIIRTSPDHGTAFDIAGKNKASETSMRNAIYLAIDIYQNNKLHKAITANPLPIQSTNKTKRS